MKPKTVILHSRADDVILIADSEELLRNSGLPDSALIVVGTEHRLADPESLAAMLEAVERFGVTAGVIANPVSHEAGVPNRFGVGTLLVISTMYAMLFAAWRLLGGSPQFLVWVTLFFSAVGLGQMLLYKGQQPRKASAVAGACAYSCMFQVYAAYKQLTEHAIPGLSICGLMHSVPAGALLGYLAGSLIASHFLLIDKLKSLRVRTKDIDPADGASP